MSVQQKYLENGFWVVQVSGRLDQMLNSQLDKALTDLLSENYSDIIVDLSQTDYINSGGLRCLVSAWRKARQNEGDVWLCGLNGRLQEIFNIVGFDKVFHIYPTLAEARAVIGER